MVIFVCDGVDVIIAVLGQQMKIWIEFPKETQEEAELSCVRRHISLGLNEQAVDVTELNVIDELEHSRSLAYFLLTCDIDIKLDKLRIGDVPLFLTVHLLL